MRILICTHFLPPGHLGGTEVLTMDLARGLQALDHDVRVICVEDWETAHSYRIKTTDEIYQGIFTRRFRFNWKKAPDVFGYLYNNPQTARALDSMIDEFRPDIIHITSCYTLSASILQVAKSRKIPLIFTATDFWFLCGRNTLFQSNGMLCNGPETGAKCVNCMMSGTKAHRLANILLGEKKATSALLTLGKYPRITRQRGFRGLLGDWENRITYLLQALKKPQMIFTSSKLLQSLFVRYGVPPDRIAYSLYGLDTSWAKGYQQKIPSDKLRIGYIGQIIPIKGLDLLIQAFKIHNDNHENRALLKIYGDLSKSPTYSKDLIPYIENDPSIEFHGTFPHQKMGEILSQIDFLVVPSRWYDFPLVIPSAFATNTPVIATDLPGMNELVTHGVDGLLFERDNLNDLARNIEELISQPATLERLRDGIPSVKTVDQMVQEYELAYFNLCGIEVSGDQLTQNVSLSMNTHKRSTGNDLV